MQCPVYRFLDTNAQLCPGSEAGAIELVTICADPIRSDTALVTAAGSERPLPLAFAGMPHRPSTRRRVAQSAASPVKAQSLSESFSYMSNKRKVLD